LTGATGFLGMQLLARYVQCTDRRIYVLVRGDDEQQVTERVQGVLCFLFGEHHPYQERVIPVRGDITQSDLGLGRRREALAEQVGEIVHGAASVSFDLGLQQSRAINVEGTRHMLEFAARCQAKHGLGRFTYISTAYVAGEHSGSFSEDDLDVGQSFRNAYEHSKFEAERLVGRWRGRLPITVVRPSIIVGERTSGWTSSFNVLYWPLRAFSRGAYVAVPARSDAPVAVVSVDYVADAIFALSHTREALGATFHITAGRSASHVGELVGLASAFFERPAPRLIDPMLYRRLLHPLLVKASRDQRYQRALRRSEVFFPYLCARVRYDDRRTRAVLHGSGIEPSPLRDYFHALMQFAQLADWGKRQIPQARPLTPLLTATPLPDAPERQHRVLVAT
jgi:thioester reductase-like protein